MRGGHYRSVQRQARSSYLPADFLSLAARNEAEAMKHQASLDEEDSGTGEEGDVSIPPPVPKLPASRLSSNGTQ